jgi:hypothetical protein
MTQQPVLIVIAGRKLTGSPSMPSCVSQLRRVGLDEKKSGVFSA